MKLHQSGINYDQLPTTWAVTMSRLEVFVPQSHKTTLSKPEWKSIMEAEILALQKNETWKLIPRRVEDNVIATKWIFKVKLKQDGSIECYKARPVANEMRQVHGLDYLNSFSLVVQPLSMQLVLTLAITNNWPIHQIDVSNAFLHRRLDEQIVVTQPPGFTDQGNPDHVCLLQKSLYGPKQSPRCWFRRL